jgi:aromatic-L-amino-acid decarboxylase
MAYDALAAEPDVELAAPLELSLFAFRFRPTGASDGDLDLDVVNRRLLSAVNQRQRVLLTGTTLRGAFFLRFCVLSFRTHADRIAMALEDLRAELALVRGAIAARSL